MSGPGHWKVEPNLQKGSLTPAGPCGWFLIHRGHCHMEKGWRGWVWSFGKLWEDDVKFKRKTQMLFFLGFFSRSCCWTCLVTTASSVFLVGLSPAEVSLFSLTSAELHSSGKMDEEGSWSSLNWGTMRAGVRKLDYCLPLHHFPDNSTEWNCWMKGSFGQIY